jgi:hypothetical protein
MGPREGLDAVEQGKLMPLSGIESLAFEPEAVNILTELSRLFCYCCY